MNDGISWMISGGLRAERRFPERALSQRRALAWRDPHAPRRRSLAERLRGALDARSMLGRPTTTAALDCCAA
jgi:hypothetical protein